MLAPYSHKLHHTADVVQTEADKVSGIGVCHISLDGTTCTAVGGIYVQGQEDALLQRCSTSLSEKRVDVLLHLYTIKASAQICGEYIYIKCSTHVVCCRSNYLTFTICDVRLCSLWRVVPYIMVKRPVLPQSVWELTTNEAN